MLFGEEVSRLIAKQTQLPMTDVLALLETPPDQQLGDVAFPCFILAKKEKKSPLAIAQELAQQLKPEMPIERIIATGPYVNFFFHLSLVTEHVLNKKFEFANRKERIMVEHSNANTHKNAHIGHLRNMALGDSLSRLLKKVGYRVVNAYYINDGGMHVATCLWALDNLHKGEQPKERQLAWLGELYAQGAKLIKEDPEAQAAVKQYLLRYEQKDPSIMALWKKTWEWSMHDWQRIFEQLELLPFDAKFYESDLGDEFKPSIQRLKEKGIIKESKGALIADLEEEGLHIAIIQKSDGSIPYLTKDIALAEKKFENYELDRSIYVVGSEQELHFQQLFKLLELDGFAQAKKCYHLSYGLVMLASGKMSSREGKVILLDDLFEEVFEHALAEVRKRHDDWLEKQTLKVAHALTLAAIKFPMVFQEPKKPIIFDVRASLDFEGETGPYLQYAYARLTSIMRKYGKKITSSIDYESLSHDLERGLLKMLEESVDTFIDASEKYRPAMIARFALSLTQATNTYYHAVPILKAEEKVKKARLHLISKIRDLIGECLSVMGIPLLDEM